MSSTYNPKSVFDVSSRTTIFRRVCLKCLRMTNFIAIFSGYDQTWKYLDLDKSFRNAEVWGLSFSVVLKSKYKSGRNTQKKVQAQVQVLHPENRTCTLYLKKYRTYKYFYLRPISESTTGFLSDTYSVFQLLIVWSGSKSDSDTRFVIRVENWRRNHPKWFTAIEVIFSEYWSTSRLYYHTNVYCVSSSSNR